MTENWFPTLNASQFGGSTKQMAEFAKVRLARLAREAFQTRGRGVLLLQVDTNSETIRPKYITMETDDGSESARKVRAHVDAYDPATQAVMVYRDARHGIDVLFVTEIPATH